MGRDVWNMLARVVQGGRMDAPGPTIDNVASERKLTMGARSTGGCVFFGELVIWTVKKRMLKLGAWLSVCDERCNNLKFRVGFDVIDDGVVFEGGIVTIR